MSTMPQLILDVRGQRRPASVLGLLRAFLPSVCWQLPELPLLVELGGGRQRRSRAFLASCALNVNNNEIDGLTPTSARTGGYRVVHAAG